MLFASLVIHAKIRFAMRVAKCVLRTFDEMDILMVTGGGRKKSQ